MFENTKAYSGFAVDNTDKARAFYAETLGVPVSVIDDDAGIMTLHLAGGRDTLIYRKPDFTPATYTILNFEVDDVDAAVEALTERGVEFERYEGMPQDEKGIMRGLGPDIAWFRDPAGNIISVVAPG